MGQGAYAVSSFGGIDRLLDLVVPIAEPVATAVDLVDLCGIELGAGMWPRTGPETLGGLLCDVLCRKRLSSKKSIW